MPDDGLGTNVYDASFSYDGRYLAYIFFNNAPNPNHINIWDIEMQKLVYVFPRNTGLGAYSFAFSPNSKYFAVGFSIFLFDFEKIKEKIEQALSGVKEEPKPLPATIIYPNPTHDVVQVRFTLDIPLPTTIEVLDLTGRMVKSIENKLLEPREYVYTIDLTDVASGSYQIRIKAGNKIFNEAIVISR